MSSRDDEISVRFRRLDSNQDLPLPSRATEHAAGYDVRSSEADFALQPRAIRAVSISSLA